MINTGNALELFAKECKKLHGNNFKFEEGDMFAVKLTALCLSHLIVRKKLQYPLHRTLSKLMRALICMRKMKQLNLMK